MKSQKSISIILKRDGRKQKYDRQKIAVAIWKSLFAVTKTSGKFAKLPTGDEQFRKLPNFAAELAVSKKKLDKRSPEWKESVRLSKIVENILIKSNGTHQWRVEEIQDVVEQVLLAAGRQDAAKAYILYRNRRSAARKGSDLSPLPRSDPFRLGMSQNAYAAMAKRYLWKDKEDNIIETPKQAMERVATAVAVSESQKHWRDKYLEIMTSFEFVPAGCYFRGAGNKQNGSLANCFVLPVEDSIEQIFDAVKWSALIHAAGGGTGFNFSHLRPRGDLVRGGGLASGPINFMKAFDAETQIVMQAGQHRGANMGILNVDHPDIFEFIRAKSIDGEVSNFNISVGAFDKFMRAVEQGSDWPLVNPRDKLTIQNIPARSLWQEIISLAHRTGDPGMIYLDTVNRANPVLKSLGSIESTNVCIAGDTRIVTNLGLIPIKDIAKRYQDGGLKIAVDNRTGHGDLQEIVRAVFSGRKKTVKLVTKGGYSLVCTPDHKVMTDRGWVEAGKLAPGKDQIYIQQNGNCFSKEDNLPLESDNKLNLPVRWSKELGLVLGWLVGDGWLRVGDKNRRVGFTFGQDSQEAYEAIEPVLQNWHQGNIKTVTRERGVKHLSFHSKSFSDWFVRIGVRAVKAEQKRVPESIFTAPKYAVVGFLQGLFSADGTVRTRNDGCKSYWVCLTSKSKELLEDVQLLLLQFGIKSNIYDRSRKPRSGMFAYTKKSGQRVTYQTDGRLSELGIFGGFRDKFRTEIGFIISAKQQKLEAVKNQEYYHQDFADELLSVTDNGEVEVFDLTEPVTNSMLANGLYIHNCGEQPLHPFDVCNLGSINLSKFVIKPFWENFGKLGKLGGPVNQTVRQPENQKFRLSDFPNLRYSGSQSFQSFLKNINWSRLEQVIRLAVRFLDDGIDASTYPIPQISDMAHQLRRIGLGVMGWTDMLVKLGVRYDSDEGVKLAEKIMKFIQQISWDESQKLSKEKGVFPLWKESYFNSKNNPFGKVRQVRNVAVTTIAPTGTISMIADCSSGIEPYFALEYTKNVVEKQGLKYTNQYYATAQRVLSEHSENSENRKFRKPAGQKSGNSGSPALRSSDSSGPPSIQSFLKNIFRTAHDISPDWHVRMQAAFQKYTDNAVSKTINFAVSATAKDVENAYLLAWKLGCKGITVYRDGSREGQILKAKDEGRRPKDEGNMGAETPGLQPSRRLMQSQMTITPLSQRAYQYERRQIVEESVDGHCPECGSPVEEIEGCSLCRNCGYSRCSI